MLKCIIAASALFFATWPGDVAMVQTNQELETRNKAMSELGPTVNQENRCVISASLSKPDLRSRSTRWLANACNETVQFSLGEFRGKIASELRGHVAHKPDHVFESISVRH
jgi:hypothetical protein